ncbi:LOW QUALITY PROTEIN: ABC transport system transmembrane protein, partial [Streptomyces griseoflavus Tu4000]
RTGLGTFRNVGDPARRRGPARTHPGGRLSAHPRRRGHGGDGVTAAIETPAAVTAVPRASGAAVIALARFETRWLLLRAPVLAAFAVYIGWTVWRTRTSWDGFPALQDADRATQGGPLLVGLAVLFCANHAVLRSRRHDTDRHLDVLVVQPWRRTVAHLLSVAAAALLTGVCVAGQFTWEALKPGAVGHGSPGELLAGPLSVLVLGTIGVLLARLLTSPFAAPLLIVLLFFLHTVATAPDNGRTVRWLVLTVGENTATTLPSDLLGRPAAWHALYLTGLALTAALLAVLVSGGARLRTVRAGVVGAVALILVGAVAQGQGVSRETTEARVRASATPEKEQKCAERGRHDVLRLPGVDGPHRRLAGGRRRRALPRGRRRAGPAAPRTAADRGTVRPGQRRGDRPGHPARPGDRRHGLGRQPRPGVHRRRGRGAGRGHRGEGGRDVRRPDGHRHVDGAGRPARPRGRSAPGAAGRQRPGLGDRPLADGTAADDRRADGTGARAAAPPGAGGRREGEGRVGGADRPEGDVGPGRRAAGPGRAGGEGRVSV